MTPSAVDAAAHLLLDALRGGSALPRLPASCRPSDITEALAIQHRLASLRGDAIGGWKAALPTSEKTIVAPIFAASIHTRSPCPAAPGKGVAMIEPEIAFVMARDLPPRAAAYTEGEVRAAIGDTCLVLELLGCRYAAPEDVPFPEMLADGANHFGLFRGPALAGGVDRLPASFPLAIDAPGRRLFQGAGRHGDGHPLRPLVWLANFLGAASGWNATLRTGQIVTTGSYAGGAVEVPLATPITVTYGDLGRFTVTLEAA